MEIHSELTYMRDQHKSAIYLPTLRIPIPQIWTLETDDDDDNNNGDEEEERSSEELEESLVGVCVTFEGQECFEVGECNDQNFDIYIGSCIKNFDDQNVLLTSLSQILKWPVQKHLVKRMTMTKP